MSNSGRMMSIPGWRMYTLLGGMLAVALGAIASATPQDKSKTTTPVPVAAKKTPYSLIDQTGVESPSFGTTKRALGTQQHQTKKKAPPVEGARLITKAQARDGASRVVPAPTSVPDTQIIFGNRTVLGTPPNNECAGAMPMTCGSTDSIFISDGYTSQGVASDPTSTCEIASGGPFTHDASWWYEFTAPAGVTEVTVTMCDTAAIEDAVGTMFTSTSTCAALSELACDDDTCDFPAFSPPEYSATVVPGQTYLVLVDRYTGGTSTDGPYIIEFVCDPGLCGNGACDEGEDTCNCPDDCDGPGSCGDGICCASEGEVCDGCVADCGECPPLCEVCYSDCGDAVVCPDETSGTPDDWITNVTFAGIDNTTGSEGCDCSFGDYTAMEASVVAGETSDLTVSVCSEGFWTQFTRAWFDWNGNGEMECDESVLLGSGVDTTLTVPVTVPADTAPGCYAMRVIEQFSTDPGCTGSCTGGIWGETEDYTVCVADPCNNNDICEDGENSCNCASDCGDCPGTCIGGSCCGDGNVANNEQCDTGTGCGNCPWDADGNGTVGAFDLAILLGFWGPIQPDADPEIFCLDADDPVDNDLGPFDLAGLLGNWGDCPNGFGGNDPQCIDADCSDTCECALRAPCCAVKGDPTACDELLTADECTEAGGDLLSEGSTCDDCPPAACIDADGECNMDNGTPGCNDPVCCAIVCNSEPDGPFCCNETWDQLCADLAADLCVIPVPFDDCGAAGDIFDGLTPFDTTGANTDGLPVPVGQCNDFGETQVNNDIWYNYIATCDGLLQVTTCEDSGGSAFYDSDLAMYTANTTDCADIPCPPGNDLLVDCNDDECSVGFHSTMAGVPVTAGVCYKIRVGGWSSVDEGPGELFIECVQGTVCGDAVCEGAEDCCNCEADCGACVCGDGTCEDCESNDTCPADCDPVSECVHDDGSTENALGLIDGGEIAWIQQCDGGGGAVTLESVSTTWGNVGGANPGVSDGDTARVYVWSDPTQDGDPCDAVLVCETTLTIDGASIATDVFQVIPLDPACGSVDFGAGESFFIGASAVHVAGTFPAPMDTTAPDGNAWLALVVGGVYDPNSIGGQDPCPLSMAAIGFSANWMLRANFSLGTCGEFGCEPGENSCNCPGDCGAEACGNGICCASAGEDCNTCAADCGDCPFCGDGSCNGDEDCASCEADCGVCTGCDVCYTNCDDITGPGAPCIDNGADDWISNVTFAGINNTTGTEGCPCSYGDHSALQASVVAGQTHDLTVSICSDGQWVQFARAWFDWNGNLDFECDESVLLGSGVDPTLTAPVMVPAGTAPGCYAMRVIDQWSTDPGCDGACTGATFGETEDYTVCVE